MQVSTNVFQQSSLYAQPCAKSEFNLQPAQIIFFFSKVAYMYKMINHLCFPAKLPVIVSSWTKSVIILCHVYFQSALKSIPCSITKKNNLSLMTHQKCVACVLYFLILSCLGCFVGVNSKKDSLLFDSFPGLKCQRFGSVARQLKVSKVPAKKSCIVCLQTCLNH